jgi:hypothetical protein
MVERVEGKKGRSKRHDQMKTTTASSDTEQRCEVVR